MRLQKIQAETKNSHKYSSWQDESLPGSAYIWILFSEIKTTKEQTPTTNKNKTKQQLDKWISASKLINTAMDFVNS